MPRSANWPSSRIRQRLMQLIALHQMVLRLWNAKDHHLIQAMVLNFFEFWLRKHAAPDTDSHFRRRYNL